MSGTALALLVCSGCADDPEPADPAEALSVVLISPDSLRVDRLRPWGVDGPETPHFDRLRARGTTFANAWSTSPWTAPSMVSVMTGLYPPSHGVVYRDDTTPPGLPTLPRLLEARGYEIGNFSFFSQISYFRNLGLGPAEEGLKHRRVAESFAGWLAEQPAERPVFAWVHLLETHLPYGATGYRAKEAQVAGSPGLERAQVAATVPVGSTTFELGDRNTLLALYDQDVLAMDRALGLVLDALEDTGRLDRTIVVYVADHGEEILDHGWVGHASTAVEAHLHPEIVHVPLVVAGPGVPAGVRDDALVQQTDILPTLARLLGFPVPDGVDAPPLPGIAGRWTDRFRGERSLAYFDSSPGGNLTPQERRGERLQGVTDGRCILSSRLVPGRAEELSTWDIVRDACADGGQDDLHRALESWRAEQAARRIELLAGVDAPDLEAADGWTESIDWVEPAVAEGRLSFRGTGGQIALAWDGEGSVYWLEYRLLGGEGLVGAALEGLAAAGADGIVDGVFYVEQERVVFGPIPEGFWNEVAGYSPIEVRVLDADNEARSAWIRYEVEPAG